MQIIHHDTLQPWLDKLAAEPEFQCGTTYKATGTEWYRQPVTLECPLGELAKGWLNSLALCGTAKPEAKPIDGKERFNAQAIEGKAAITRQFFGALLAMRDILPEWRGRIIVP